MELVGLALVLSFPFPDVPSFLDHHSSTTTVETPLSVLLRARMARIICFVMLLLSTKS